MFPIVHSQICLHRDREEAFCGHVMAGFDEHAHCTRCRDKLKGDDPRVSKKPCSFYDVLTPEQKLQISTPSYQKKKEKREQKAATVDKSAENVSETLVDPCLVSVVGVVSSDSKAMKSPQTKKKWIFLTSLYQFFMNSIID